MVEGRYSTSSVLTIFFIFFFFNNTPPTEIYTLPLHDALPILRRRGGASRAPRTSSRGGRPRPRRRPGPGTRQACARDRRGRRPQRAPGRPAGRWQDDARASPRGDPAAPLERRGARGVGDLERRGAPPAARPAHDAPAVPRPAPHDLGLGPDRRR